MCRSVNVYVGGCCVRRLSASDGEGSIGQLQEELSRSLDPLVLEAKLEEEGCEAPALSPAAETEDAPATFLALLCSFGMLARGAAIHVETKACAGWPASAARAAGWPRRAGAGGSLRRALPRTAASGERQLAEG